MELFKIDNILEEINTYDINKDNWEEFLLQTKDRSDDIAFFFYKSSLLQLIQVREHLDKMLAFYYGVDNPYLISDEISIVYKSFLQGDTNSIKRVLRYAKELDYDFYKIAGTFTVDFNNNSINTVLLWLKKLDIYIRYKKSNKIKLMLDRIITYLKDKNAEFLLSELNLEQINIEGNNKLDSFYDKFKTYYNFIKLYHNLGNDIINMTSIIKNYSKIKSSISNNKSLRDICLMIRKELFKEDKLVFRQFRLKPSKRIMAEATEPDDISKYFDKLSIQFRDCLEEQDIDLFIRKCADFHYDFIRVHPFKDGNGRTSRILLTTMLMSRNIMLPTLYTDYDDKCNFYITSDTALDGDYRNIEQNLFMVLGRYYPNVIPRVPNNKKSYDEVNNNRGIKR